MAQKHTVASLTEIVTKQGLEIEFLKARVEALGTTPAVAAKPERMGASRAMFGVLMNNVNPDTGVNYTKDEINAVTFTTNIARVNAIKGDSTTQTVTELPEGTEVPDLPDDLKNRWLDLMSRGMTKAASSVVSTFNAAKAKVAS